jgi:thiol-disulfide isomerase/thioredoxin
MKKYFPLAFLSLCFTAMLVLQMAMNGRELSASKIESNKERYSVYENQFQKFKYKTSKGTLVDLKNEKTTIVIINFWASWCRPCLTEFKGLNQLIDKFGDSIKVIGINNDTDNAKKEIEKIEKKHKLKFESIISEDGGIADKFNVTRIPATIIYHNGKVIEFSNTEYDFMNEKLLALIESKLKP